MATVNKNFKVKNGLVVEGATATVNGNQVLTETASDQYIINLIGGETLVTSVESTQMEVIAGELNIKSNVFDSYGSASAAESAANSYTDGEITTALTTAQGYANTAESNAESYANSLAVNYDPAGSASTAQSNAETFATNAINALDTDDIEEGASNKYFSDSLARGAVSAGDGLNYDSNTGAFTAHLGNGLEISGGAIRIDDSIVATETDLTNAINAHNNLSDVHGVTGEVLGTTDTQTVSNKTLGSDLAAGGFQITNLGTPTNSTDAATKAYVDAVSEGLHVHDAARVATTTNVSIANGLENGDVVDGITLATGDRVLVKNQTLPAENGIYVVQASGQALRASDFDTATEVASGDFIFVVYGTQNANSGWVQTNSPATIGTDAIAFVQFSGAGTYTAGNGLDLDGTIFSIDETITATRTYVDGEVDAHTNLTSAHGTTGNVVGTSDSQTLTNKTLGSGTVLSANIDAANTYTIANLEEPVNNQDAATKFYVDGEVSGVSGDLTTHETATTGIHGVTGNIVGTSDSQTLTNKTIDGSSNTISNIANASLVNDSITINGSATALGSSVTLDTDDVAEGTAQYFTSQRALNATAAAYDPAGSAATAQSNANSYTDTAISGVNNTINALTTDDVAEGANEYFTDAKAKDSAAALLTTATLSNITITGTGNGGLVITAENGVADSTTTDLTEGTNLYFTDARAKDAAGAAITGGTHTNVSVSYDNVAKTISLTGAVTYTDEDALDAVGDALTAGSNIAITPNDNADTITVALVDDVVIPSSGSLEVESNNFNVGSQSVGLRTSDSYTNPMGVFSIDADDDYAQLAIKNTGNGVNSSTDFIAYANNGDDTSGWVDLGITSSTFNDPSFTITGGNDGYIFMEAPSGTSGNGDLVIATGSNGAENRIVFAAGGLQSNNTQMTITPDESVRIVIPTASTSPTTGALVVDGGVGIQGDVNIQGTITFGGSGTTVTTDNLAVQEPVIYLADGNTTDNLDTGIVAQYNNSGTKYAGIVRDATDGVFKLFSNATTKPTSTVNFAEAGLEYGDLKADAVEAASGTFTSINIAGVVDETEIGYLNGVTSSVQTQLDAKLPKSGGTMSGAIAMGTNAITGMANPTNAQDAATKAYVDGEITSVNNAVGALDTDDIAEGSALYFTNTRAVDALEAVVPNFTAVELNSIAKQVAATATITTAGTNSAISWLKADYRSAEFLVKIANGTHTEVSKVILTLDTSDNIAITEYSIVGTNGSLGSVSADVSGSDVRLRVTTANNNSTVAVIGTLLA